MILCKEEHAKKIDSEVFPGGQGGPLMHVIAAKAVALKEAMSPAYKTYQTQVVSNSKELADAIAARKWRIVSGGTDNHLCMIDVAERGLTGKAVAAALDEARITVNKNTIPFDKNSPFVTSGIRIGTGAVTTRGMKNAEMKQIADLICDVMESIENGSVIESTAKKVAELTDAFPLYQHLRQTVSSGV